MLPGGIVWVLNGSLNVLQIILYFTSIIFVPLIPMCIADVWESLLLLLHLSLREKMLLL